MEASTMREKINIRETINTRTGRNGKRSQRSNGSPAAEQHATAGEEEQHGAADEEHEETAETNEPDAKPKPKNPPANLRNAVRAIESLNLTDVYYDQFLQRLITDSREWTDADDRELAIHLQSLPGFTKIGVETGRLAALTVAFRRQRNCVKDWLDNLVWDQEPRIDHFFEDHFGAKDTTYMRAVSRNFWISMAARVCRPGCQQDHMIVLEGVQGIGKSSALRLIGGEWFCEQHEAVTGKDFFVVLQGKLLIEISELDAFRHAALTKVKQVITCTSDRFRNPFGRHAEDHARQCIFAGTTNKDDWNQDETGARRFWPIACEGEIDIEAIRIHRDQFFAEAVFRFKAGEPWWEMPAEETQREQEQRYVPPAWVEPIEKYITHDRKYDESSGESDGWFERSEPRTELSISEIFESALELPASQWTKQSEVRAAEALRFLGWKNGNPRRQNGKRSRLWIAPKPEPAAEEDDDDPRGYGDESAADSEDGECKATGKTWPWGK
jgi:predicted P-loop ATPase